MTSEPEVQGINLSVRSLPSGLTRLAKEPFLSSADVERKGWTKFPADYNPLRNMVDTDKRGYGYFGAFVVFCGRLYRGVTYVETNDEARHSSSGSLGFERRIRYRTYWDLESFMAHHYVKTGKDVLPEFMGEQTAKQFMSWFSPDQSKVGGTCVDLDTPVLVYALHEVSGYRNGRWQPTQHVWVKNGLLKDLQFAKVFTPDAAFQELSMYVGGVMVRTEKPEPVPDKLKIQAHGMDHRSFRKDPTKVHV